MRCVAIALFAAWFVTMLLSSHAIGVAFGVWWQVGAAPLFWVVSFPVGVGIAALTK